MLQMQEAFRKGKEGSKESEWREGNCVGAYHFKDCPLSVKEGQGKGGTWGEALGISRVAGRTFGELLPVLLFLHLWDDSWLLTIREV